MKIVSRRQKKSRLTPEDIAREIRIELRSIFRQKDFLTKPFDHFTPLVRLPENEPRYYVNFGGNQPRRLNGLRISVNQLMTPNEKITDEIYLFASAIWHLKDRLYQWAKATKQSFNEKEIVENSKYLQVCADLVNKKKHGRNENRSGLLPRLSEVYMDTSKNGILNIRYDGANKIQELIVTNPVPIYFHVNILNENNVIITNDAVEYIWEAFICWCQIIKELDILSGDNREAVSLREQIYPVL